MVFKKLFCVLIITVITLSVAGCKDKNNQSSGSEGSEQIAANTVANDAQDPENNDYKTEQGSQVKAEDLKVKKGLANGIDVSKWQGKINWQAVKKSGIDFAIIRIGYRGENGTIYKDAYADYNIQQADKAGLLVGVYFFSTATSTAEAIEEAKWVASAIKGYPISYPVIYNCEGFNNTDSRMYNLTNTTRTDNALAFLNHIKSQGYDSMFYAAKSELENSLYWDTVSLEASHMIWVARYTSNPYPQTPSPDYSGKYDMWQYTDKGAVNGIKGNTDMVVSYFTRSKANPKDQNSKPQNATVPSESDKIYTAVTDEVTAKQEVNLRDAATTKSNIVGSLKNGTFLKRTATGSNGWSKLTYNGKTVYAITSYLTTDKSYKPPVTENTPSDGFTPSSGEFTAKEETNLRAEPNTNSRIIATIKNGEFVTRTGVHSNGWTKLLYKGQTAYAKSSLLTTTVNPPKENSSNTVTDDGFLTATGKVTAKEETNLRTAPTTKDSQIVYTLKSGEFAELLGRNINGWSKLNYNGQTVYAITNYLITEEQYNNQQSNASQLTQ